MRHTSSMPAGAQQQQLAVRLAALAHGGPPGRAHFWLHCCGQHQLSAATNAGEPGWIRGSIRIPRLNHALHSRHAQRGEERKQDRAQYACYVEAEQTCWELTNTGQYSIPQGTRKKEEPSHSPGCMWWKRQRHTFSIAYAPSYQSPPSFIRILKHCQHVTVHHMFLDHDMACRASLASLALAVGTFT